MFLFSRKKFLERIFWTPRVLSWQPSKRSSGDVKCSFDDRAVFFFRQKSEWFMLKLLNSKTMIGFFHLNNFSKTLLWHKECSFDNHSEFFSVQSPIFLLSKYIKVEKLYSSQNIVFPQNVPPSTQIAFLTSLPKRFRRR